MTWGWLFPPWCWADPSHLDMGVALPILIWNWPHLHVRMALPPSSWRFVREALLLASEVFWWAPISGVGETNPDAALCLTLGCRGPKHTAQGWSTEESCLVFHRERNKAGQFTLLSVQVMRGLKTKNFDWEQSTGSWSRWITKQQRSCFYTNSLSTKTKEGKLRVGCVCVMC